jgi:predicted outer membrane protein
MTFKPAIWRPIAIGLAVINVVATGFAANAAEPVHAATHAALALLFGYWASHLNRGSGRRRDDGLEALEVEVGELRRELGEAQERMDFAERLLAQRPPESLRVDRERGEP